MIVFVVFTITPYYFIHYSDPQIGRNQYTVPYCSSAVSQIMSMTPQPSFIIVCGDMADNQNDTNILLNQWRICDSLFNMISIPKFFTPGNHDIGYASDTCWKPARLSLYRNFWNSDYYVFQYDSCLFISLNSTLLDTYSGHPCYAYSLEQDSFLRANLSYSQDSAYWHIFLFFHFPLYIASPTEANSLNNVDRPRRDTLLKYLRDYNISGVFTGHLHYDLLNFYGPSLLMTGLPTCENNINSCGYRVVKVYQNGIETFVVYLSAPIGSVSMVPIVQAQVQSETLFVNAPFWFNCTIDTISYPQWQGATVRWIFQTGDTLYIPSGNFIYTQPGNYQILCQVYRSPHYSALYRFPVYVREDAHRSEIKFNYLETLPIFCNSIGDKISVISPVEQHCSIFGYSVDGKKFNIYKGILKKGKQAISLPAYLGTGIYFVQSDYQDGSQFFKFIYLR
jgi:hypothetical protein